MRRLRIGDEKRTLKKPHDENIMACPSYSIGRPSKEIELNGPKIQTKGKRYNVTYSYLRNATLPTGTAEHELSPRAVFWRFCRTQNVTGMYSPVASILASPAAVTHIARTNVFFL